MAARRRVRLERQVLATLDHPNIAELLGGGLTDDDVPYLVMEYVEGRPLTAYCDAHRCSVDERLQMLRTVADALSYAHRNMVVHRDLKPANILVTDDGQVKVLDFGIAKLLDAEAAGITTPDTRTGVRPMTPAYAAPEQVRGAAISAATDVYQWGVLAYELLTGRRPHEAGERSAFEVEQAVLEDDPARPSTVVEMPAPTAAAELSEADPERIGAARATTPKALSRTLAGDLDAILLKALRKDPDARYASPNALRADLERYQEGQPVQARPITPAYRLRKFARRHRGAVLAGAAGVLAVIAFVGVLLQQRRIALEERDRARTEAQATEQVAAFMVDLFRKSTPTTSQGEAVTATQLLRRGRQRVEALDDQPVVQAQLLDAMGQAHEGLGRYDTARVLLERALRLRRQALGASHPDVAESLDHLADVHAQRRDYEAATPLYRRAVSLSRETLGPSHPQTAARLSGWARALRNVGAPDSAVALARDALAIQQGQHDSTHTAVIEAEHALAYVLRAAGAHEEAVMRYRRVLDKERARYGADHFRRADTHNDLAYLLKTQGQHAAAETHYRRALSIRRSVYGPAHPKTTRVMQNLAGTLWAAEKYAAVESILRERVRVLRDEAPADTGRVGTALGGLARFLAERGRFAEAVEPARATYALYRSLYGPENLYTICKQGEVGALLDVRGRGAAADSLLKRPHDALRARRDTVLRHRDTYTRLDVRTSLRTIVRVLERGDATDWLPRYRALRASYAPDEDV